MASKLNRSENQAYQEWLDLCKRIEETTTLGLAETAEQKTSRIAFLKSDFSAFCKYYFPDFIDSDFGWFHHEMVNAYIYGSKNEKIVAELPREHAKSVVGIVFLNMFAYANGLLDGLVVISNNHEKAKVLLGDLQAQFDSNLRFINDYGELAKLGSWSEGNFTLTTGEGFWALGRGMSPRGLRKGGKRPNRACIDDIDDDEIVQNESRVDKALRWALKSLYPALPLGNSIVLWLGNRIHKKSILAKYVGDYETGKRKRKGIIHIKAYAIENPKTRKAAWFHNGQPAWKERYTLKALKTRCDEMGEYEFREEYMHEHIQQGKHFKNEWQHWATTPPLSHFSYIIAYGDPSLGESKNSCYKAVVVLGVINPKYKPPYPIHLIDAFCRQCSSIPFTEWWFDLYERLGDIASYKIEANALQKKSHWKLIKQDFENEEKKRGYLMPIRPDSRVKENKNVRIESLIAPFELGRFSWAIEKRDSDDFENLWSQFSGYPDGFIDGCDAWEGANHYAKQNMNSSKKPLRTGKIKLTSKRRI